MCCALQAAFDTFTGCQSSYRSCPVVSDQSLSSCRQCHELDLLSLYFIRFVALLHASLVFFDLDRGCHLDRGRFLVARRSPLVRIQVASLLLLLLTSSVLHLTLLLLLKSFDRALTLVLLCLAASATRVVLFRCWSVVLTFCSLRLVLQEHPDLSRVTGVHFRSLLTSLRPFSHLC